MAECPDSWESMENNNSESKHVRSLNQRNENSSDGVFEFGVETQLESYGEGSTPAIVEELASEMTRLKTEMRRLKSEIKKLMADKDREQEKQTTARLESMIEEL